MRYIKYVAALFLSVVLNTFSLFPQQKVIWQLGQKDGSANEFALAPDGKDKFVNSGFGSDEYYFYAGDTQASSFPYILPGPTAKWAGGTYWAGQVRARLPVFVKLENVASGGDYDFEVALAEVGYEEKIFLRVEVNGEFFDQPLQPDSRILKYRIPATSLKEGINKFVLQLFNGQHVTFDSFTFAGSPETRLQQIGNDPVVFVSMADYELEEGKQRVQPLLVEVISKGSQSLKIEAGGKSFVKKIEKGRSVYEIPLDAVKQDKDITVKILADKKVLTDCQLIQSPKDLRKTIDYVNQFAGSSGSRWSIGPGPWMPSGMVKIMPDNEDFHWKSGYEYNIENIAGFSHIHEWTMAGLLMMPATGKLQLQPGTERNPEFGYRSRIDKKTEKSGIGYYTVDLLDYDIKAELTATTRASLQRYTFNKPDQSRVLIDFFFPAEYAWTLKDVYVKKISDTEIEGWTINDCHSTGYHGEQKYKLHFVIQTDKPFSDMNGWIQDVIYPNIERLSKDINPAGNPWLVYHEKNEMGDAGIFLNFDMDDGESVMLRTGISLVSIDNARLNLETEVTGPFAWNFDQVVENQRTTWDKQFEAVKITTDDYLLKEKFYTNLYRSISPRTIWNDVNGEWMDMNDEVAKVDKPGKDVYGGDGMWGCQWTLNPFYNLLYPKYASNWIYTYEQFFRRGGWLPHGNPGMKYFRVMVGSSSIPLIVSAFQHGIRDFDTKTIYDAILHQQTSTMINYQGGGQVGNESYPDYITKGYVPLYKDIEVWDSPNYHSFVSNTMEYAYQDYCAAQYFKSMDKMNEYSQFMKRSDNWKNIFDPSRGYIRARYTNGSWASDEDAASYPVFCEGSAWQFTWYVPHNVEALRDTIGEQNFIDRLNIGFEVSEKVNFNALGDNMNAYPINHGNEANMQAAYLFNFTSEPWHTQKWTRAIQEKYYGSGPRDAYPGDEDQGQMSSWYVINSIGLFALDGGCSADPAWYFGSPRFEKVEINLDSEYYGGKKLIVEAEHASRDNCYIQSVTFNGKRISKPFINWSKLKQGGKLRFVMGNKPNKKAFLR